jgi:hypothetical protein
MQHSIKKPPEVHEAKSPDVRRVRVVEHPIDLLAGESEGEELVEDAEGGADNAPSTYAAHLTSLKQC